MELQRIIDKSRRMVFFGGAGVSTESGIPDFRSVDGLYHQQYDEPPETILSHSYFMRNPEGFFRFYRQKMLPLSAKPNAAHLKLAELERAGRLQAVITQNIDGLHQKAGSRNVLELHGSIWRNHCMTCGKSYTPEFIRDDPRPVPLCTCGGRIKPDVVLYEEGLDEEILAKAIHALRTADTLIVAGTSLTVYPAAGLIRYFRGNDLVLINRDATPMDGLATMILYDKVGEVLSRIRVTPPEGGAHDQA